ncbi:MAG: flagellar type III secretion system protein FliR [Gammaproteobacteria bacterium]|nr:flagellar type III secretion system protein FliR [Gammaproteobacteria bacterium]
MGISEAQMLDWVSGLLLPLFRIAGLLLSMMVTGTQSVPARVRMGLAFALTVMVLPILPPAPKVDLFALNGFYLIAQESLIGIVIGFVSRLLFQVFVIGGQLVAMQSGLGFASMVDPVNGLSVPVVSQFYLMLTTLLFVIMNGHIFMIELIVHSFTSLPIGTGISLLHIEAVVHWGQLMFNAGLMMALAAALSLLMINLTFGVLTRAAPQLNLFSLGFPITMVTGLVIVWITLSGFLVHFESSYTAAVELMCRLANGC